MEAVTERVDSLFSAGFLFVTARTTEGGIKTVFVQRLFQAFSFHNIGMFRAAMNEWINPHRHAFRVFMHQQLAAVGFRRTIAELIHLAEFPAGIDMQQRERQRTWIKRLARQMQHDAGIFTDRVEHHRI